MRINAIAPYSYRSNLNKCTKPCKDNETQTNAPALESAKQELSFGTYASKEADARVHAIGYPFHIRMPDDPLAVSPFVYVYIDSNDDKLKARLNKDLIEKRGIDGFCKEQGVYSVFEEGHPDNIVTSNDIDKITYATAYTHLRFSDIHRDVFDIFMEHKCAPDYLLNCDEFIKFKGADDEGLTLNFEFARNPFKVDRELPKKKGFFAAIERLALQAEMQEAKMKNAEVNDIICEFEEKHNLPRGWEVAPMDCRTEDGVKRLTLILELHDELHNKMYPPQKPKKELSEAELKYCAEIQENNQRFGYGNWI